ncbi:MAG TPA: nicotinate-nucleotide adenylyltransferase [Psychromonas hadalis]|nr:nicotinate-nucleotide adenylyltransferase [Psychromonas hadalis]
MNDFQPRAIGFLGGSFDPIHFGHLRPALEISEALNLKQLYLMPNHIAPHKSRAHCTSTQRAEMVKLTTANQLNISVDTRELLRDKASYTIDSLIELQANHPDSPLCFIMGMDSLLSFNSWHRWEEILDHCHIIVSHRPGWRFELNSPLQNLVANHQTDQISDLHTLPSGKIYFQKTTQLDISSTQIRSLIKENKSVEFLLPEKVITYIKDKQIYQ